MIKVVIMDYNSPQKRQIALAPNAININNQLSLIKDKIHPPYLDINREEFRKSPEEKLQLKEAKKSAKARR